jgi:hypothetical protein
MQLRSAAAGTAGASPRRGASAPAADDAPIFLTVGTTSFDALVRAADDPAFAAAAQAKGYTSLTIQARQNALMRMSELRALCALHGCAAFG